MKWKTESGKRKIKKWFSHFPFFIFRFPLLFIFCFSAANFSCRSAATDLRALAPAGALVYLETNDLGKMLEALTANKTFQEIAASKPDFSAVENVQFAVAVTSFETGEQPVADNQSILNFKPHFVAIADTHRWKPTAVSIAETEIGKYARAAYGDDVKLEKSEKADANFFVWTSRRDGRKIFAAVSHSIIYAGNDEKVIDECLEIRGGGVAENLSKNEFLARARQKAAGENNIAFGYVSGEGVAQIADIAAVSLAIGATESGDARSFIARVATQIFRKSVREISWTAKKTGQGIEDEISITTTQDEAHVFKENLQTAQNPQIDSTEFLPTDVFSATRYNLQNPQTAWRSLLFVAAKQTGEAADAKILTIFSSSLFEPYGISDAGTFLSAIDSDILTVQFDDEGEKSAAVFTVKDVEKIKKSIGEINFKSPAEKFENAEVRKSDDGEFAAAFVENKLITGDYESVLKCLEAKRSGRNSAANKLFQKFVESRAVAVTVAKDTDSAEKIVGLLGVAKDESKKVETVYFTETDFTETGVERRIFSAFGLIGTIIGLSEN